MSDTQAVSKSLDAANVPGPVDPAVISPAPAPAPRAPNAAGEVVVRVRLPLHVLDAYTAQAQAISPTKDPESLLAERLIQCLPQHDRDGVWFDREHKQRLEAFLGRKLGNDAAGVLQRLEPLRTISVEGTEVKLPATTLQRLSTRTRRGQTLPQLIVEQVVKALKQYVGELPY